MPSKSAITVSLTPELQEFIAARIEPGRYRSASEVVREALRYLERVHEQPDHVNRTSHRPLNGSEVTAQHRKEILRLRRDAQ